jgi:hypothetical protein
MICEKDVADCICEDRVERLRSILNSKYLLIGEDYRARILKNIESSEREKSTAE